MTSPTIDISSTLQLGPPQPTLINSGSGSTAGEVGNFLKESFQRLQNSRRSMERQWYINLSFFFGKQYVVLQNTNTATNSFRLYVPPAPPWRVRLTINKIRPIVRKEIAKLFGQKPRFDVAPAGTEDIDLTAARAAENIFDYVYETYKVQQVLKQAGWWTCIVGTGFVKAYWDSNKKDPFGQPGDFCIEAVSPFNIFVPDFRAYDIEDEPYVIHATMKDMAYCQRMWPTHVKKIATTTQQILEDTFLDMKGTQNNNKNNVLVLECWIKPGGHPKLPNGGLVTIAGDEIVQYIDKFPYDQGKYPFYKVDNIPSERFYSPAMVDDLIPLQKEYNRTRSQIVESKNMMGKPKLLAARGSIDAAKVNSEPGQVVFYQPGFQPPVPMTVAQLPQYVLESVEQLDNDMLQISGQNDVTGGGQVTSATALSFLQEQDDTMLSDTTDSLEGAISRLGGGILSLVNQYWNTPRKIKIVGTDGAFDAASLSAADLRGNTDLRVESGSALPKSLAAKQAFVMDLLKIGAIQPQDALEMLEIGGIDKIYDEFLADRNQAQRENIRFSAANSDPEIYANEWDNHQAHIAYHNKFRKGTTYELMPISAKTAFQIHVQVHQAALIIQQNGDPTGSGEPNQLPAPQAPPGLPPGAAPTENGPLPLPPGMPPLGNAGPPVGSPDMMGPPPGIGS